jgi:hypothetical protein
MVAAAKVAVTAALSNRKLRQAAFFFLTLDPRKLRPDQRSMHRAFFDLRDHRVVFLSRSDRHGFVDRQFRFELGRLVQRHGCPIVRCMDLVVVVLGFRIDDDVRGFSVLSGKDFLVESGRSFFLSPLRNFSALVGVLGIARRTTSLLDILFDHRDDGMVGEPPLARTVVVQYVTETQPALLHSTPPRITV